MHGFEVPNIEPDKLAHALELFNICAVEVCEGQQLDMNFEIRNDVNEEEYLEMIRLKTAVLLGFSLNLGAYLGGATERECQLLKEFGENVGVGFQLKDDLLDVYGDKDKFGKQVGGDIIANKKTLLLIKAHEKAKGQIKSELNGYLHSSSVDPLQKVEAVTNIYGKLGIRELAEAKMNEYFAKGFSNLDQVDVSSEGKNTIREFTDYLINRDH